MLVPKFNISADIPIIVNFSSNVLAVRSLETEWQSFVSRLQTPEPNCSKRFQNGREENPKLWWEITV